MIIKHYLDVRFNYLVGTTFGNWWRLLKSNHFSISPLYWHRALFVTGLSLMNSVFSKFEQKKYSEAIRHIELKHPPLFILGHWRSGTTHLHNLLALNDRLFGYMNTYQVANPQTYLITEKINSKLLSFLLPQTRIVDNMLMSFQTAQEDEFALALLGQLSPYLGISFPLRRNYYLRYLDFQDVSENEITIWKTTLMNLVRKLTYAYPNRMIILKSPPHTARIRHLLDIYPNARFIHIHRHPYTVFQSTRRLYETLAPYGYLQRPAPNTLDTFLIEQYHRLYEAFFNQKSLIPEGQLYEVAYEQLEKAPVDVIRDIYAAFDLEDFSTFQPTLERYLGSIRDYKKNSYPHLSQSQKRRIFVAWENTFEQLGYLS